MLNIGVHPSERKQRTLSTAKISPVIRNILETLQDRMFDIIVHN